MFNLSNNPGRTAIVNGKEHLFFSGYSYLGMNHVPGFVELVKEGIDKYGFLFPSSRISNTQLDLFNEFEAKLSAITGMEATVCFSSGFLAGRAVADMYQGEDYTCAPQTHPAICLNKQSAAGFD
jgi:7-keto-8-aminopelargonate synthetase-like enzyme